MRKPPMRTLGVAVLLASSAGAQVVAGANGGVTPWLATWLLVTVAAAGAAGLLSIPASIEKKSSDSIRSDRTGFETTSELDVGRDRQIEKSAMVDIERVDPRLQKALSDSRPTLLRESRVTSLTNAFSL
ncbi:hypothetical protein FKR81_32455 [Lentzea tibetensis]|uniref:Uncharacterized protein n=1 Tax=Lentzea tibetensis TaxID=2591470 RepID=A0A563EK67_9PSEU|nr:hypothetical protein [Lentzea tibetensis]TWP47426.1 hypothetical protein FKR81_32455 [Lentzea tibetensis]